MKSACLSSFFLLLGCSTAATTVPVQTPASSLGAGSDLAPGKPVEREIGGGQSHDYGIALGAGQFVRANVEQRGIDVVVRVHGPDGEQIDQIDSSGNTGREPITLFATQAGVHRIQVEPVARDARPGRYAITIERVELAAKEPAGRVDQLLSPWDGLDRPGAAVAVVHKGEVVYARGHGSANLEYGLPIEPDTVFQIASVSKQFTAFAVTMLAEQGALSLDDDLRKHLPELPDFGATITLRHLLHHTSGLRDQWALLALSGRRLDDVITSQDILTLVRHQRELNFAPGTEFSYSNTGYTLLAEVVARVTGKSFAAWTAANLFAPLGMDNTHFHDNHELLVRKRASSYDLADDGSGYRNSVLSFGNVGASNLYTTVEDLAKWAKNLDTGAVGGAAVAARVQERAVLQGKPIDYASGLYHGDYRGLHYVGHSGSDAGYRAALMRYPDHGLAVIVLSNDSGFSAASIAHKVAALYLAEHVRDEQREKAEAKPAGDSAEAPQGVRIDGAVLDSYAGRYRLSNGMEFDIQREGDGLVVQIGGRPAIALVAETQTRFLLPVFPAHVIFEPGDSDEIRNLTLNHGGVTFKGEREKARQLGPDELARYAGVYFSPELETFYRIEVREGTLIARHRRNGDIVLGATDTDSFASDTWYFERVVFTREGDAITGMRVSNGRMRNIRFDRQPAVAK